MNTESKSLLIKNGLVHSAQFDGKLYQHSWIQVDLLCEGGKIKEMGPGLSAKVDEVIDAEGLHVLPGLIDSQVHFREPGMEHKEDLETGTLGAVLGGITSVYEMPNTNPLTISKEQIEDKIQRASQKAWCDFAFFVGATPTNAEELVALEKLPGVSGIKIFMGSSTGDLLVEEDQHLLNVLSHGQRRIAIHCEDEERLRKRFEIVKSGAPVSYHRIWRDEETALKATQRIVSISQKTGRPIHCLHITTNQEIHYLEQMKNKLPPGQLTVEVTPQHLSLMAETAYDELGTKAQMNPPIRSSYHQRGLWEGIKNRTVDVIGSDHAPHTLEEKAKPYPSSPSGMTGVQTIAPIMLNHVNNGKLSLERFVELLSLEPARIYKAKNLGPLHAGRKANITLVDMNKERVIEDSWIASRSGWTPYHNWKTRGWPVYTIVNGQIAMKDFEAAHSHLGQATLFDFE